MLRQSSPAHQVVRLPWRHYWPAGALTVVGLILTAVAGGQMERWAQARDSERFAAEARLVVGIIEQKMERYESAMGRLGDAFARENGEVSNTNWSGWITHSLGMSYHYPNVIFLLVAPRIASSQKEAFEERARAQVAGHPGTITTSHPQADQWFPVWRRSASSGFAEPSFGDDLLSETHSHPSFEEAMGATVGWVSERPARLVSTKGESQVGFWFVVPLRRPEQARRIQWQWPNEAVDQASRRRSDQRAEQAIGLLAAFIGGELFLNEFNETNASTRVQLFTSGIPGPERLVNPNHSPPGASQHTLDVPMPWYGRQWTARLTSSPVFESGSLRYRTWLVRGAGGGLSLAAGIMVSWAIRGRWREAMLAAQLREALGRQERLSRDLHDGTLQSVYGIGLALQRAQRLVENRPAELPRQITETAGALQRVIAELRDFIRQTDPGGGREIPLGEALAGVVEHQRLATEMELELVVNAGADLGLTSAQALQLLNIAREALSNSIRHSGGQRIRIALEQQNAVVRLEITDDGRGFDPAIKGRKGSGLRNLAARVEELGGSHRWMAGSVSGCALVVEVPLNASPDSAT